MKVAPFILFVYIFFSLVACSGNFSEKAEREVEVISICLDSVENSLDLADFLIETVSVVPLETHDSCLLSDIHKMMFRNDTIYVSDQMRSVIFVFDDEGRYVRRIGRKGGGPGEYSFLGDFDFWGDSILIQDLYRKKYILHSLHDGGFREIAYPHHHNGLLVWGNTVWQAGNYYVTDAGAYNLYRFDLDNKEVVSYAVPFDEEEAKYKNAYGLRKRFACQADTALLIFPSDFTIYRLSVDEAVPAYQVSFSERALPPRLNVSSEEYVRYIYKHRYLTGLMEVQPFGHYLLGCFVDGGEFRYLVYDTVNHHSRLARILVLGMLGGMGVNPGWGMTDKGEWTFTCSASMLLNNWKLFREQAVPSFRQMIDSLCSTLREDSNPVIFKCRLKK